MAQRTIHYLFGEMISKQVEIVDKTRFLLGSIMPDAVEVYDKEKSHFKIRTDMLVYIDFEEFRNQYFSLMQWDDLYLGYYMHLVEDAFYRAFIYQERFTMPRTREEVKYLHNDYHILNSYIVNKYSIRNELGKDIILEHNAIDSIANFTICESLNKLADEFTEQTQGVTVFLNESMLDEFIDTYIPLAIEEVRSLKNGVSTLRASDYTWLRNR